MAQGSLAEAQAHLEQALSFYENGRSPQALSIQASLAWLALEQGNLPTARQQIEPILDFFAAESLAQIDNGLEIYWKCFKILQRADD